MIIATIQMKIDENSPDTNLKVALELMQTHVTTDKRAKIYTLPEMFTSGYDFSTWAQAAAFTNKAIIELSQFAQKHNCAICGSMPFLVEKEIADIKSYKVSKDSKDLGNREDKLYNRMFFIDHNGEMIATYDKVHLFAPMDEDKHVIPGDSLTTFKYKGFNISMLCCFDLRFPVPFYRCALKGTELFLMCAQWPASRIETMEVLCRARAIETQSYLSMSNRIGDAFDNQIFGGHSLIVNPVGEINVASHDGNTVLAADIDKEVILKLKNRINVIEARSKSLDL